MIWKDKASGGSLFKHLRQSSRKRKKRYGSGYNYRGHIKNRISIDDRPPVVETRERIGDWEIYTIIGKSHKGALVSIVERKSRFTLLSVVNRKDSELVGACVKEQLLPFKDYVLTITGDNGKEFACHEQVMVDLNTTFYFAHPYSSYERGLNENTNGLIRQYVPKGSEILHLRNDDMIKIMEKLNNRPRKCLGYRTPKDVFLSGIGFTSLYGEKIQDIYNFSERICTVALTN
ncbi:Mobile element protein [Chitinispirillum alkaliphilum]|nr:Mobile element protein [Chitinispirillum alkaliphilum]